ncbi:MAG: NTP transferase domain-containing protein, partial [Rhodospirillales bacterium]|nr:NTP transferase domain-containing protein [Rhodospirillales bacterium]
ARSLKLNGFDWVLQRIFAGVDIAASDIMRMGAGGLLMEIPSRPLPRTRASPRSAPSRDEAVAPAAPPRIAALVLAAGQSRRMGALNKLLIEVDGEPMVRRVAAAALASRAAPVLVVTGHEAERVRAALDGLDVTFAHNPDYAEGMSSSLQRGVEALDPALDGAVVCLGDMPRTSSALIDRLIAGFNPLEGRAIGVPTYRGKRGNPVLWAARHFGEIRSLSGDVGARHLIGDHADAVYEVESPDHSVTIDVDTPEALDALRPAAAR